MTTFSRTWDTTYEALPTDDNYGYEIDNYIRQNRVDIRERLEVDHEWNNSADDGKHKKLTLTKRSATPTVGTDEGGLYVLDVGGIPELFFKDKNSRIIQLTYNGNILPVPTGTRMWFYNNSAPAGWTILAAAADALLAVKGGSNAYNVVGGIQAGSWTPTGHTHPNSHVHTGPSHQHTSAAHSHTGPDHNHKWYDYKAGEDDETFNSAGTGIDVDTGTTKTEGERSLVASNSGALSLPDSYTAKAGTGNTSEETPGVTGAEGTGETAVSATTDGASASPATDRPLAQVGIICSKD